MSAIKLKQIRLKNFRSYSHLLWKCSEGLNIIKGPNASGKTNLLEAVGYLSFSRSFRQQHDEQVIKWGKSFFQVEGLCSGSNREIKITIEYQRGNKRLEINGHKSRMIELLGVIPVIFFVPDDLNLVKSSPVYRRQYLDREISIIDRVYCQWLQSYRRILMQRNKLLREIKFGKNNIKELEPWSLQIINLGSKIISKRSMFLSQLSPWASDTYKDICGEKLRIVYLPNIEVDKWQQKVEKDIQKEIDAGATLWGPHRDDFAFFINNYEGKYFSSQGQQRSAVLSLKIAGAKHVNHTLGLAPALLLDDVFSELDDMRQQGLLEILVISGQTFLTTTDIYKLPVSLTENATIWTITEERDLQRT